MKFNCGLPRKQRQEKKQEQELGRLRRWHKAFLLFPIRARKQECRWLEFCELRYPNAKLWRAYDGVATLNRGTAEVRYKGDPDFNKL